MARYMPFYTTAFVEYKGFGRRGFARKPRSAHKVLDLHVKSRSIMKCKIVGFTPVLR